MTDYLAVARHHIGEDTASIDLHLGSTARGSVVAAHAVQLLADYGSNPTMLAWIAAEAMTQLIEERLAARAAEPVMPPAADEIRLASDFSDNQPLGWAASRTEIAGE